MDKYDKKMIDTYITPSDIEKFGDVTKVVRDSNTTGDIYFNNARIQIAKSDFGGSAKRKFYYERDHDVELNYDGPFMIHYDPPRINNINYIVNDEMITTTYLGVGNKYCMSFQEMVELDNCWVSAIWAATRRDDEFSTTKSAFEYASILKPITRLADKVDYDVFDPSGQYNVIDTMLTDHYDLIKGFSNIGADRLRGISISFNNNDGIIKSMIQFFDDKKLTFVSIYLKDTSDRYWIYPKARFQQTLSKLEKEDATLKPKLVTDILNLGLYTKSDIFAMLL